MIECQSLEDAVYALALQHIMCDEVLHADAEIFTPTFTYA
jgi:hypothetical protein